MHPAARGEVSRVIEPNKTARGDEGAIEALHDLARGEGRREYMSYGCIGVEKRFAVDCDCIGADFEL